MAGHRAYGPDKIGALSKLNSTTVQLAASTVTLGGLQYDTANLQILTVNSGIGGIDTGSVQASRLYHVYFVLDGSDAAITASLSDIAPTGFTVYSKVDSFTTNDAGAVLSTNKAVPVVKTLVGAGTYNVPSGVKYLKITAVGAGGGGGGTSNNGTNNANAGNTGQSTTFGGLIVCNGGQGGRAGYGGYGGVPDVLNSEISVVLAAHGGAGDAMNTPNTGNHQYAGGKGGDSILGGGAAGHSFGSGIQGRENTGGGGAGSGLGYQSGYIATGGGGGAGAGIIAMIPQPQGSYSFHIGDGGLGGSGQLASGASGASGTIIIEEYYN